MSTADVVLASSLIAIPNVTISPQVNNTPTQLNILEGENNDEPAAAETIEDQAMVVSEEVLKWRERMKSSENDKVTRRWYPRRTDETDDIRGYNSPDRPLIVDNFPKEGIPMFFSTSEEEADENERVPGRAVPTGWYTVTICVSLKGLDPDSITWFALWADRLEESGRTVPLPCTRVFYLGDDLQQLKEFKDDEFARLRFHNEVPLEPTGRIVLNFRQEGTAATTMIVHYVEVAPREYPPPSECDFDIPDQIVSITQPHEKESGISGIERRHVHAMNISDSGTTLATLSFTKGRAFLELWNIDPVSRKDTCKPLHVKEEKISSTPSSSETTTVPEPEHIVSAYACATFPFPTLLTESVENIGDTGIATSYSGSKVVIMSSQSIKDFSIPFMLFQCPSQSPKDADLSEPWPLKQTTRICESKSELQGAYGRGRFNISDTNSPDQKNERFIFSDGLSVSVYDASEERWTFMHRITLTLEGRLHNARSLISSIKNRYMVWTGYKGIASVWNVETGKPISHIGIDEGDAEVHSRVSTDGSMVLVASKGAVSLYQTLTGIRLGTYKEGLTMVNTDLLRFTDNYIAILDDTDPTKMWAKSYHTILSASDMSVKKNVAVPNGYAQFQMGLGENVAAGYCQGSVVSLKRFGEDFALPVESPCGNDCPMEPCHIWTVYIDTERRATTSSGESFEFHGEVAIVQGIRWAVLRVTPTSTADSKEDFAADIVIPIGPLFFGYQYLFHESSSKLIIVSGVYIQVWTLSEDDTNIGILESIRKVVDDHDRNDYACDLIFANAKVCAHGRKVSWDLTDIRWYDRNNFLDSDPSNKKFTKKRLRMPKVIKVEKEKDEEDNSDKNNENGIQKDKEDTVDGKAEDVDVNSGKENKENNDNDHAIEEEEEEEEEDDMPYSEEERLEYGFRHLIPIYLSGHVSCKNAVVEFLKPQIRPQSKNEVSCIIKLVSLWSHENKEFFELILIELLRLDFVTWIPDIVYDPGPDPVRIMLKKAKLQPSARASVHWIIDYCVTHAVHSKNLAFLTPVFANMKSIMKLYPDKAIQQLARVAYLPVPQRDYILDHHTLAVAPRLNLKFWNKDGPSLNDLKDPVMRLGFTDAIKGPVTGDDAFTGGVFMASFDALWCYKAREELVATLTDSGIMKTTEIRELERESISKSETRIDDVSSEEKARETDSPVKKTNWYETLFWVTESVLHVRYPIRVVSYDFNLEYLENPAIAALVAYKWNTIGFHYWMIRFLGQCVFYSLVIIAALMQVYYPEPARLVGLFIAIIVLAVGFIWLEILQALQNWDRYGKSIYNVLDMVAFALPLIASTIQLYIIYSPNVDRGNIQVVSFSVLAVALHLLFELRIIKSVCKYVTIIQQAITEIRVFFIVFACGIFAFAIATLHLTQGCAKVYACNANYTDFPRHFFYAVAGTYFFMGGNYNPVDKEFAGPSSNNLSDSANWGFQVMMIVYFFFTVILMMNVLISLINVAFDEGGGSWRLVWIESRLRCIESAENMSYYIPGYRETYDVFPEVIYYTATEKQVKEYRKKFFKTLAEDEGDVQKPSSKANPAIFKGWARDSGEEEKELTIGGYEATKAVVKSQNAKEEEEDEEEEYGEEDEEGTQSKEAKVEEESTSKEDEPKPTDVTKSSETQGDGEKEKEKTADGLDPLTSSSTQEHKAARAELIETHGVGAGRGETDNKNMIHELKNQVVQLKQQLTDQQKQTIAQQKLAQERLADLQRASHSQFTELKELMLTLQQVATRESILHD
ncbi:hypothetical protein BGZ83_010573 [Gryganskiella cystojenkinii]|nr:hypothetical protein BGZ83_010573 [Gryganskiella cystojenkinii]